jgi:5-methylcytosine-specific restriction endonuclease McrA
MPSNYQAVKLWRHNHPEQARIITKVAKGLKRSASFKLYWPQIVAHYGPCVCCPTLGTIAKDTVVDHVVPYISDPLTLNKLVNLQPLCRSCNSRKGTGIDDYRPDKGRWIVRLIANDPIAQRPLHRSRWKFAEGLNVADYPERFITPHIPY